MLFRSQDRSQRDRVEKRNRAEALTFQAERQLREATLDFGMQFVDIHRRVIEKTVKALREAIAANDDIEIDRTQADLQDALYNLNRDVRDRYAEEEDDDFFGSIRRTFQDGRDAVMGGGYDSRDYGRGDYGRSDFGRDPYGRSEGGRGDSLGQGDRRREPSRPPAPRDPYDLGYGGGYNSPADRPGRPAARDGYGRSSDRRDNRTNGSTSQPRDRRPVNDNWDDDDDWF